MSKQDSMLFAALLKYWRGRRGWSQLDLSVAADTSTRHVSYMENGRSHPSEEMVCRLGAALDVPLRAQNDMLRAAGHQEIFEEPELDGLNDPGVTRAIERMMLQHEPYPMVLMTPAFDILRLNEGARRLLTIALPAGPSPTNAVDLMFGPLRHAITSWETTAQALLSRLNRERLHRPHDERLAQVLDRTFALPHVPASWRQPDFSTPATPTFQMGFALGTLHVSFLTTLTIFSAPQNVTLDELIIESYFPLDEETERVCEALAERTPE